MAIDARDPTLRLAPARALIPCLLAAALAGCTGSPAPALPTGIAQIQLRQDAATLRRIAAEDDPAGSLDRRRAVIADLNRQTLMAPPADALVPELFDLVTTMAPRMESRDISPAWASYVYTSYQRDLVRDRPTGQPRRTPPEVKTAVDGYVEYYRLRAREGQQVADPSSAGMEDTLEWRRERRMGR
jgi:hypothetical protein